MQTGYSISQKISINTSHPMQSCRERQQPQVCKDIHWGRANSFIGMRTECGGAINAEVLLIQVILFYLLPLFLQAAVFIKLASWWQRALNNQVMGV